MDALGSDTTEPPLADSAAAGRPKRPVRDRKRLLTLTVGIVVVAVVAAGGFWNFGWMIAPGIKVDWAIGSLPGVKSAKWETNEADKSVVDVVIEAGRSHQEVTTIVKTTERLLDEGVSDDASITLGSAKAALDRQDPDRAEALLALAELGDDRATLIDEGVIITSDEPSALASAEKYSTFIREAGLGLSSITVEREGRQHVGLDGEVPLSSSTFDALRDWDAEIDGVYFYSEVLELNTTLPLEEFGPLADAAQSLTTGYTMTDPDDQTLSNPYDDADPKPALSAAASLTQAGVKVTDILANLRRVEMTTDGELPPDLPNAILAAGFAPDAIVSFTANPPAESTSKGYVEDAFVFRGPLADFDRVGPALFQARADGYKVRYERRYALGGPDITLTYPEDDADEPEGQPDYAAVVSVARSIPWEGVADVSFGGFSVRSTATGRTEEVSDTLGNSIEDSRDSSIDEIRGAWNATATDG